MFVVIFRNRKRAALDTAAYAADAEAMATLARAQPGYISFKSYVADDGEVVAISEWEDEAAALGWRRNVHHAGVQARGRNEYYQDYTLMRCNNPEVRRFERADE